MGRKLCLKMKHSGFLVLMLIFASLIPIVFQSCSEPLVEENDVSVLAAEAPFAFDLALDHIAYMSCSNMPAGYNPETYFTFKAGAYKATSGLKFNSSFVHHVRNVTATEKVSVLAESEANKNAYLSLGVRMASNILSGYRSNSDFIGILTAGAVANILATKNGSAYVSNFPALATNKQLEDTAHYTGAETTYAQPIRDAMNAGAFLATTYNTAGADTLSALSPNPGSTTQAYGLGYRANFNTLGFGLSTPYAAGPMRIMSNLREFNLTTGGQTSSVWDCNPEWRFMIIRPTDDVNALCPGYSTDATPPNAQLEMYLALRQLLPPTAWGVNLSRRCIVPLLASAGQCYGSSNVAINYSGGVCDPVAGTCPHYVSICKKR